jgi:hypothetical protein
VSGAPERPDDRRRHLKRRAAAAFAAAMTELGLDAPDVAPALCLGVTRVKRYRSTDRTDLDVVPSTADLIGCDEALFGAWLARLRAERLALHGPPAVATVESELCAALAAKARTTGVVASALANGAVEPAEVPAIESALDAEHVAHERVRGLLRARGAT